VDGHGRSIASDRSLFEGLAHQRFVQIETETETPMPDRKLNKIFSSATEDRLSASGPLLLPRLLGSKAVGGL
jgi:hypothetical protein